MSQVIGFPLEPQVERGVSGFVAQSHMVLPLARTFVSGTMFVATVLSPASFIPLQHNVG